MIRTLLHAAVLALAVGIGATATAVARQSPAPAVDPLPALLTEVHALRMAMERSALVAPRIQITMSRLQFEEQRITQLAAQLDRVRQDLGNSVREEQIIAESLAEIERRLVSETDEVKRRAMLAEEADLRRRARVAVQMEQETRTRESEVAQLLSTEQGRWTDLNAGLDRLERLLEPVR